MHLRKKNIHQSLRAIVIMSMVLLLLPFTLLTSGEAVSVKYLYPKTMTLSVGETTLLKVSQVNTSSAPVVATFTSLYKKIATVDIAGNVTGLKKGTATITIKIGKMTMRTKVKVVAPKPSSMLTPSPTPTPIPTPSASNALLPAGIPGYFIDESNMLELVNAERAMAGLGQLTACAELKDAANLRAYESSQLFGHTRPNGELSIDLIKQVVPKYGCRNENLAKRLGYGSKSPSYILGLWMNSEGHRKNILRPQHTKASIGVYEGPGGWVYWAILFVGPRW